MGSLSQYKVSDLVIYDCHSSEAQCQERREQGVVEGGVAEGGAARDEHCVKVEEEVELGCKRGIFFIQCTSDTSFVNSFSWLLMVFVTTCVGSKYHF